MPFQSTLSYKTPAAGIVPSALAMDWPAEAHRIEAFLLQTTARRLRRRGIVVGVSGGVDSALCATLAVRALGPAHVFALLMPERESSAEATDRGRRLCEGLGIEYAIEDISDPLDAVGCYRRRDEAVARLFPAFNPSWRHKIVLAANDRDRAPYFNLVAEDDEGRYLVKRMPSDVFLQVVSATNFKQRLRKNLEYYHAERLNYAVLGTPNRLEYDLGFFVRGGDGLADIKPIAHLYKTQVYALAEWLGVPEEIRRQAPSTDTYSLPQSQEEFYFSLPYAQADMVLHAMINGTSEAAAATLGLTDEQMKRAVRDFSGKRRVARRSLRQAFVLDQAVAATLD